MKLTDELVKDIISAAGSAAMFAIIDAVLDTGKDAVALTLLRAESTHLDKHVAEATEALIKKHGDAPSKS